MGFPPQTLEIVGRGARGLERAPKQPHAANPTELELPTRAGCVISHSARWMSPMTSSQPAPSLSARSSAVDHAVHWRALTLLVTSMWSSTLLTTII